VKVGDLVVQIGYEGDGYGLVIEVDDDIVNVLWLREPCGMVNMWPRHLAVISKK